MKTIFFSNHTFWLLSLSALGILGNNLSAIAQTVDTTSTQQLTQSFDSEASPKQESVEVENFYPNVFNPAVVEYSSPEKNPARVSNLTKLQQLLVSTPQETASNVVTPLPGTTVTSSEGLSASSPVAQADINPGQRTRGGSSYVGIGGNIGLGGESALGDGNFMVISKIGITNTISVRPAAVIGDNTVILIPVTYDFTFRQFTDPFAEPLPIAPYIGAGAAIDTGDGTEVSFLLSGGVDVPITPQFTATAAINAAFFDDTDIGLSIGVGYNFSGLFGL